MEIIGTCHLIIIRQEYSMRQCKLFHLIGCENFSIFTIVFTIIFGVVKGGDSRK